MVIYIIEHLEADVWDWCILEYTHLAELVGPNHVWFTNVSSSLLPGKIMKESVTAMNLQNVCVLDPAADKSLTPDEAKKFDYFVFGGILGNDPPQARTGPELTTKMRPGTFSVRNIGEKQLSTDTAVYVVHEILGGKKMEDFEFVDGVEIQLGKNESTVLPYRYVLVEGKPWVSEKLIAYLKEREGL